MVEEGLWGQWHRGAHAIRSLAHIAVAAESTHGRSPGARAALLVGSLTSDAIIARRRRTTRRRAVVETLVNVADVGAWSWLTRHDPVHMVGLTFATLAPNLMESAFRLRAGTTAVPVVTPPSPWQPLRFRTTRDESRSVVLGESARRLAGFVGELLVDALPTVTAMTAVRRGRGLRTGSAPFVWAVISVLGGSTLARVRDRAQQDTTEVWDRRTRYLIEEARIRSRVQSALVHNVAEVDPKALLTFLERAGSVPAGAVLDDIADAPIDAVSDAAADGLTLSATVDQRSLVPSSAVTRWVPRSQVRMIRDAMAAIDERLVPLGDDAPDDDEVVVVADEPHRLVLSYRGARVEAAQPVPDLAIRLEPTLWPVLASAVLTLSRTLPGAERPGPAATALALVAHTVALTRLLRTPPMERRADRVTAALLLASTLAIDVSVGRNVPLGTVHPLTGERVEENAATSPGQGMMMLLGASWHDLRREAPYLLAVTVAGWLYSLRIGQRRSLHSAIGEAAFLFMPLFANLGTGDRTRAEAELLDRVLQERLSATIADTARVEARVEIDRFLSQLDCVIDELPRLHPSLSDDEVAEVVATYTAERARVATTDPLELIGW